MPSSLPVWRSILYVPANVEKFIASAHTRGADCIQLDLEDSVVPSEKERARAGVAAAVKRVGCAGADVIVRVNRPLRMAVRDIEAAVCAEVLGLTIPKVDSAEHLRLLDELVSELEIERGLAAGATRFVAIIESAEAYLRMPAIATATPRLVAMILGAEDFALDLGIEPEEQALTTAKQQLIIAARAAGLMPLGLLGSIASYGDNAQFEAMALRSRRFGFMGATCIHPRQVPILNRAYAPTSAEIGRARAIVQEAERARAQGRGAFEIDGLMVDAPIVQRAEQLLARHAILVAREARLADRND
jgi:citrate lyase subunit beta/citryl-CoA lyase